MSGIIEIQLGGQVRTLRFNNWQKEALGKVLGQDPLKAAKTLSARAKDSIIDVIFDLVYTGLIGAYRAQRKDIDFTEAEVGEWVGDAENAALAGVFDVWIDSIGVRKLIPEQKADAKGSVQSRRVKKKPAPGKK